MKKQKPEAGIGVRIKERGDMWQMGERLTCPPPSTHPSPLVTIVPIHLTPAACEQPCGRGANFSPRDVNAVLWARRRGVPSFPHPLILEDRWTWH